jgi:hypothetical protein
LTLRTLQRWTEGDEVKEDARTTTLRPTPSNQFVNTEVIFPSCAEVKFPTHFVAEPFWRVFDRWAARRRKTAL